MGFRDLHAFNLAMLSKQAWRLAQDTNSLFYKVYKAQYFPNCSFMTAQLGSNLSFVWRSLLAARDIIFNGSKWRVGDGKTVGIYSHKWLSHPSIPLNEPAQDMKGCELLDVESRQWDRGKIENLFKNTKNKAGNSGITFGPPQFSGLADLDRKCSCEFHYQNGLSTCTPPE